MADTTGPETLSLPRQTALERAQSQEYTARMDSAVHDKRKHVGHFIHTMDRKKGEPLTVVSIGGGSGALEELLLRDFPNSRLIVEDYSDAMIRRERERSLRLFAEKSRGGEIGDLHPLEASAAHSPLAPNSVDVFLGISVFHEISSYEDGYQQGKENAAIFQELAKALKPGGRVIIRDFMEPPNPEVMQVMEIGEKFEDEEMDPLEFIERFTDEFRGSDLAYIADQIASLKARGRWKTGAALHVRADDALEYAVHYSWSKRYSDEVKERYAYKPPSGYAKFIKVNFVTAAVEAKIIDSYAYLQPEYSQHVLGRLNFFNEAGEDIGLPELTGIVVVEKVGELSLAQAAQKCPTSAVACGGGA